MKHTLILTILLSMPLFAVSAEQDKRVMERLRVDIAELKGAPSVEQIVEKQKEAADDLLLVINSGRYEGKRLAYLQQVHNQMLLRPEPTQAEVNRTHAAMIEHMSNSQRDNIKNNSSNQNNNFREQQIKMREMRQTMKRD
jgi:hypothetical protein